MMDGPRLNECVIAKRILIVDDAATVRMYHRGILESAGYAVEEAMNGIEALEKALEAPFDLYVVDVNMPKLNGYPSGLWLFE